MNECNHGSAVKVPDDHQVSSFMDLFFTNLRDNKDLFGNMRDTLQKHPEVWINDTRWDMAIDLLTNIGTNMLLSEESAIGTTYALYVANAIIILEQYVGEDISSIINNPSIAKKMRDLHPVGNSKRRDGLKFYRKRIGCKCLKKIHLEARKRIYKTDSCLVCGIVKGRELVPVCSRCMVNQYCSRECQVADWPEHKKDCDAYVNHNRS